MNLRWRAWELAFAALLALHVVALIAHHGGGLAYQHKLVFLFHFDFERNLPTLFSVLLLARAGWLCWRAGRVADSGPHPGQRADRLAWLSLAAIFVFLAADEALSIHEALIVPVNRLLGDGALAASPLLTFAWILPYALLVLLLAAALLGWLRRLPRPTRRGFLLAAVLYVTGALLMEAAGGWWIGGDLANRDLGYDLLVTVEESLEMVGLLVFAAFARRFQSIDAE